MGIEIGPMPTHLLLIDVHVLRAPLALLALFLLEGSGILTLVLKGINIHTTDLIQISKEMVFID